VSYFAIAAECGMNGWYDNPKIEGLIGEWLQANDLDARKKIAESIQAENFAQVPTVTLCQLQIPKACRKSVQGRVSCSSPLFWNLRRA
jgi:peptide/nickel transport system substrate-binding protein